MYFMSNVCGRPQGGAGGIRPMCTHVDRGEGGQKSDYFVDVINGWPLNEVMKLNITCTVYFIKKTFNN